MDFLEDSLLKIKTMYEDAVKHGGDTSKAGSIRSGKIIFPVHEFIKHELIRHGVSKNKIYPPLGQSKPELKFMGFLKSKNQDISVLPNEPKPETVYDDSIMIGDIDKVGKILSTKSITVNVRSQLSSLNKNVDTLYERTFAESLNLHLRTPCIILGELYLVPLKEYDQSSASKKEIKFGNLLNKKYPILFNALNNRKDTNNSNYKYERAVLLVVDFEQDIPQIMYKKDLIEHKIITPETENMVEENLFNPYCLIPDLLEHYKERHGSLRELFD